MGRNFPAVDSPHGILRVGDSSSSHSGVHKRVQIFNYPLFFHALAQIWTSLQIFVKLPSIKYNDISFSPSWLKHDLKSSRRWVWRSMEEVRTSETSANLYQTTRHYNPEDSHLLSWVVSCVKTGGWTEDRTVLIGVPIVCVRPLQESLFFCTYYDNSLQHCAAVAKYLPLATNGTINC
jgi:hypothetical protein